LDLRSPVEAVREAAEEHIMKLATLANGAPDGALHVVSRDLGRAASAVDIATTLQDAMDRWDAVEDRLRTRSEALEAGRAQAIDFASAEVLAPLPRAWQWLDGSVYESHGDLMQKVFKLPPTPKGRPLMYQGVSEFLPASADVPLPSEDDDIDFEGEYGVIVDRTPMATDAADAARHIRLVVQINDWSLRAIAPIEMKTGFGWIQAKPVSSMAPVAVTPDELGPAWRDGRVDLPLPVDWNGERFGAPEGYPMAYGFPELVAHAARTRTLVAGTVIGSGTVSNESCREVGSACIAERRAVEMLDHGDPKTGFMRFGDRVRMEVLDRAGRSVFGAIDQRVVDAAS
jgi:fumarylacetoacetate (FAA) hydrolase